MFTDILNPNLQVLILAIFTLTNIQVFAMPIATSEVYSNMYRRVSPAERELFFSKLNPNQNLPFKTYPDSIPVSHYSYKIVHETPGRSIKKPEELQTDINDRLFATDIRKRIVHNRSPGWKITNIVFHDDNQPKSRIRPKTPFHIDNGFFLDTQIPFPSIPRPQPSQKYQQRPSYPPSRPHVTSIIFPQKDCSRNYMRPLEQTVTRRTTTTTTPAPPPPITTPKDIDLIDEFLDWISINELKETQMESGENQETRIPGQNSIKDFALFGSGTIGANDKKCKPGYKLDKSGTCRRQFG